MQISNSQADRTEKMLREIAGEKCMITRHNGEDGGAAHFEVRTNDLGHVRLARAYIEVSGEFASTRNNVFTLRVKSFTSFAS